MRSNVYKIKRGELALGAILAETEKVTSYNALTGKDALALRLLAEELVSMLPSMVENFDGEFWIENDGAAYELCVGLFVDDMDIATRESLIKMSSNNKNASAVGITGKIRAAFDYMVLGGSEADMIAPAGRYGFGSSVDYSQIWSLRDYKDAVSADGGEKWDELEKSIIARLATDVIVGVKGKRVSIIIKKTFE